MDNVNLIIEKWLNQLKNFEFSDYEKLPDIDLYMDQVVTFLDRQLQLFAYSSLDKQITPSMINNYVKGDVISAPISKKYNREHLALIEQVCTLKQVLSIAEVKQILDSSYKNSVRSETFNNFKNQVKELNNVAANETFKELEGISTNDTKALNDLALTLSLTANAYISIAKRILFLTRHFEAIQEKENDDKKEKKHEKKD